ncbi:sporulation protein YpjB [Salibacterium salarium]|uniref:sporulation protein YpjB n=1 Tax=Salibacterium salarium TaxID=284579 RepID=UPI0027849AC1|nr:sporulation protein YpjB [Salibacterium salarium]MDQ0299420.1 sporulation protein YpjB [Salibacterium salarium]
MGKNLCKKVFFLSFLLFTLFFGNVGQTIAEENKDVSMQTVEEKAKLMHEMALNNQYEEAKQIHSWLVVRFPSVSFDEYNMDTYQLSELFRSFDRAGEAVTRAGLDERTRLQYITAFRLAVDASISEDHPLWKKSGERLILLLDDINKQIENGNTDEAVQAFREWRHQFETIRPAMYTGMKEEEILPLTSYIQHLDNEEWIETDGQDNLKKLKELFQKALSNEERSNVDPSLWAVILSIGGVLFVSLTYAGWKKYKGEKERHQMRD